ncbi:hypothetical protein OE88DRAFT_1647606 [Heliocybe sulcata]|uniref:Uncharacterized protein n=1 Tax=Heliocybe sulcata TaxID=5364 RepID=A0A5C3MR99_9AGAM|nr:hypothetical protein OE88DRAFT_1647606 [Heliocybe sulcata]
MTTHQHIAPDPKFYRAELKSQYRDCLGWVVLEQSGRDQQGEEATLWYRLRGVYMNHASELIFSSAAIITGNRYTLSKRGETRSFHVSLQMPAVNLPGLLTTNNALFRSSSGKFNRSCIKYYADIKYGQLTGQTGITDALRVISGGSTAWPVTPVNGT